MAGGKTNDNDADSPAPSERARTVYPSRDPAELAEEVRREGGGSAHHEDYARIVEQSLHQRGRDTPRTMSVASRVTTTVAEPAWSTQPTERPRNRAEEIRGDEETDPAAAFDDETLGREMYGCYLASNFPDALVLAERVLERAPEHALAQLVIDQCRERLRPANRTLAPSSVLRLRLAELERHASFLDPTSSMVIGHIDGVADAATVVALTGLANADALARLHALLDLGVVELVSA